MLCPMESELVQWLQEQIGRGKRFQSERRLSLAAGLNQNAVNNIMASGRADPGTLVKVARAAGVSPVHLFVLMGWLTPDDARSELTVDEQRLVEEYRRAPEDIRPILLATVRTQRELWQEHGRPPGGAARAAGRRSGRGGGGRS